MCSEICRLFNWLSGQIPFPIENTSGSCLTEACLELRPLWSLFFGKIGLK